MTRSGSWYRQLGAGFSRNFSGYLLSTGKAIELADLRNYLVFSFRLEEYYEEFGVPPTLRALPPEE